MPRQTTNQSSARSVRGLKSRRSLGSILSFANQQLKGRMGFIAGIIVGGALFAIVLQFAVQPSSPSLLKGLSPVQAGAITELRASSTSVEKEFQKLDKLQKAKDCGALKVIKILLRVNCKSKDNAKEIEAAKEKLKVVLHDRAEKFKAHPEQAKMALALSPNNTSLPKDLTNSLSNQGIETPDHQQNTVGTITTDAKTGQSLLSTGKNPAYEVYTNNPAVLSAMSQDVPITASGVVVSALKDSNNRPTWVMNSFQVAPGSTLNVNAVSGNKVITIVPVNLSRSAVQANAEAVVNFYNDQAKGSATFTLNLREAISVSGNCNAATTTGLSNGGLTGLVLYVFPGTSAGGAARLSDGLGVACNTTGTIAHEIGHLLGLGHNDCGVGQGTAAGNIMAGDYSNLPPLTTGQKYILGWIKDRPADCAAATVAQNGGKTIPIPTAPANAPANSFTGSATGYSPNGYTSNPNRDSIIKNTALICPTSISVAKGSSVSIPVSAIRNQRISIQLSVKTRLRPGDTSSEKSSNGISGSNASLDQNSVSVNVPVEIGTGVTDNPAKIIIEGEIGAFTGDKTAEGDPKDILPIYVDCAVSVDITGVNPRSLPNTVAGSGGAWPSISVAGRGQDFSVYPGLPVSVTWYIPRGSYSNCVVYAGSTAIAQNVYEMNDTSAYNISITQATQFRIDCNTLESLNQRVTVARFRVSLGNQTPATPPNPGGAVCAPPITIITGTLTGERDFTINMSLPNAGSLAGTTTTAQINSPSSNPTVTYKGSVPGAFQVTGNFHMSWSGANKRSGSDITMTTTDAAGRMVGQCSAVAIFDYIDNNFTSGSANSIILNNRNSLTVRVGETITVSNVFSGGVPPYHVWDVDDDIAMANVPGGGVTSSQAHVPYVDASVSGNGLTLTGIAPTGPGGTTVYVADGRPIRASVPIGVIVLPSLTLGGSTTGGSGGSGSGGTGTGDGTTTRPTCATDGDLSICYDPDARLVRATTSSAESGDVIKINGSYSVTCGSGDCSTFAPGQTGQSYNTNLKRNGVIISNAQITL